MNKLYKHAFVCINKRDPKYKKKSCGNSGLNIRNELVKELSKFNHGYSIRINKSGCLGKCDEGPIVVVYPNCKWYENVGVEDVKTIVNESILNEQR